jgi:hypothetical protein
VGVGVVGSLNLSHCSSCAHYLRDGHLIQLLSKPHALRIKDLKAGIFMGNQATGPHSEDAKTLRGGIKLEQVPDVSHVLVLPSSSHFSTPSDMFL